MALAEIEAELTGGIPWRTCAVCHHMEERGPEWTARMRRILSDRNVQFHELYRRLDSDPDEPTIKRDALSRHARGLCAAGEVLR